MSILIGFALATVVGAAMAAHFGRWDSQHDWLAVPGIVVGTLGATGLVVCLIGMLIERIETPAQMRAFEAVQSTVEAARAANPASIENAALQVKIAESNEWLARKQHYNATVFDIWIPDAVDALEPIR